MVEEKSPLNKEVTARWEALKNRLVDELSRGITVARLATETGLMAGQIERWASDPKCFRDGHRIGEPSLAERIESSLESRFAELDVERAAENRHRPARVETSVMVKAMHAFDMARKTPALVDFTAPPGVGKSAAVEEYVANCRKAEGFACPVWTVELSEFNLSAKGVLALLAEQVRRSPQSGSEFELSRLIEDSVEGKGGLLIIEEAQHLADALNINSGLRIINGLRRYVDKGLFGIVFINNGEIYRRLQSGKHAQLFSRMESWRVKVDGVTDDDVDKIMLAWGVSGKAAREYCIKVASGGGALRSLVSLFQRTHREFGVIDIDTMKSIREGI
ncbi:AAA family ATPase [Burkholderia cepacia]|uniref:AAA family ATPase n=1 Tax=Burkholderia cepacia TaxID=292 RepID=UPI001CF3CC64|nr:AAA family ATPase [Burkholderia cepacia]MCA8060688.1 ATP-binding protein [Burkholderia cepacia]